MPMRHPRCRPGFSLIEMLMVATIVAVLASVMVPRVARMIDQMNVNGATRHAANVFVTARHAAIAHARHASVRIDTRAGRITALLERDTLVSRDLGDMFGVTLAATRDSMAYSSTGLGYGAANLRLIVQRGQAADTVFTSRVGRVRW